MQPPIDLPGPRSRAVLARTHQLIGQTNSTGLYGISLARGQGAEVVDEDGNVFLDCLAGASANILGYGRRDVTTAYTDAAETLQHSCFCYSPNAHALELADALIESAALPYDARVLLGLSGSDANGGMIEAMRRATRRPGVISFQGAYHGSTGLSQAASHFPGLDQGLYERSEHFAVVTPPRRDRDVDPTLAHIEAHLKTGEFGGVLTETIMGDAGVHAFPAGFLAALQQLLERFDALLMLDEVQCGMGRTGSFWAFQQERVIPDLFSTAKGLSAGYAPISAVVGRRTVLDALDPGQEVFTYTGHGPSSAVARRVIHAVSDEQLPDHAAAMGAHLLDGLRAIQADFPQVIAEIRGRGLMIGVEIVHRPGGPIPPPLAGRVFATRGVEKGVYFGFFGLQKQVLRIEPPLILTRQQADRILEVTAEVAREFSEGRIPKGTVARVRRYSVGL
ncbi:MAG: aspartate aminotransferase family protein [Oligoflexia bacterium]|nr:aspartate aminotransferase family protein [Oligoflexia bacterium]